MRLLLAFFAWSALAWASDPPEVKVIEEIVAKVDGDVITRGEMEKARVRIEAELRRLGDSGDELAKAIRTAEADVLRDKIDQLLLVARAKELDIQVDGDIAKRVAQEQALSKIADPDRFHQWIYEQSGMTFEDWKQQLTEYELKRRVVSQEVGAHINIPTEELQAYFEKHKSEFVRQAQVFLSEILIGVGDGSPEAVAAAEKKAKDLTARARKGEKFGDLARNYSDAETAKADGALGAFKKGELTKEIDDVVFATPKGAVTDPIRVAAGFEIFKIEDRYSAGQATFEDARDEIMEKLYPARMEPELRKYMTRLREDAFIQIRGGYVDSGAAPDKDTTWKDPAMLKAETTTKEEVAEHSKKKRHVLGVPVP
jgi:peptidyl-prolyl cis-trans isomerase SurA